MKSLILKKSDKRNSGFSLVELVVAIGILAVIGTIIAFIMMTSSKNYKRMSIESQLQSEAQLVANSISEYAIDSYDAKDTSSDIDSAYDTTAGKMLLLESVKKSSVKDTSDPANVKEVVTYAKAQYGIVKSDSKLYLAERSYNEGSGWGSFTYSLLGDYITDFNVDISHVEQDNIIDFSLEYTKNDRVYTGNYQVLMRNKAYADKEPEDNSSPDPMKLVLGLTPKQIYVDVKGQKQSDGTVVAHPSGDVYFNEISSGTKHTIVANTITLNATAASNKAGVTNDVIWTMEGEDARAFTMAQAEADATGKKTPASQGLLVVNSTFDFNGTAVDDFVISIAKSATDSDGTVVSAAPKEAKVHLRRVKSINLIPTAGSTEWKKSYESYASRPTPTPGADGYAYPDAYGRYFTMVVNANIVQKWVPYAGGLDWKLELKEAGEDWKVPTSGYARLQYTSTDTSTTNSVIFGNSVKYGQLYRVTVSSKFDPTVFTTYTFGVAPRERENGGGFNSRGFYVNLNEYLESYPAEDYETSPSNFDKTSFKNKAIGEIKLTSWGNSFENGAFTLTQENGEWYFYIDYSAFQYSQQQRYDFYSTAGMIEFKVYDTDGNYMATIFYNVLPVYVHKVNPSSNVLIIQRGKSTDVVVKADYYNIISSDYFGIYIDNDSTVGAKEGFSNNLMGNNFDTNAYLRVEYASSYGDVRHYIDQARVTVTAKDSFTYNANPMTLRLAANDYYNLCDTEQKRGVSSKTGRNNWSGYTAPCTDYTVYVANVVGQNVFISGPATTVGTCAFPTSRVQSATSANKVNIGGYDANGIYHNNIARAYMDGSRYKCEYNGNTYTYNQTYHYWSN